MINKFTAYKGSYKLDFSDLFDLIYYYEDLDEKLYKDPKNQVLLFNKDYIEIFIEKLLIELGSKYILKDYIYSNFESQNYGVYVNELFRIRHRKNQYISYEYGYMLGNSRHIHDGVDSNILKHTKILFDNYDIELKKFKKDIFDIDKLICNSIEEDTNNFIVFNEFILKYNNLLDTDKFRKINYD